MSECDEADKKLVKLQGYSSALYDALNADEFNRMVVSAYNNGVEEKVKQGNLIKHKGAYEKVVEVDKANNFVSLQTSMECES